MKKTPELQELFSVVRGTGLENLDDCFNYYRTVPKAPNVFIFLQHLYVKSYHVILSNVNPIREKIRETICRLSRRCITFRRSATLFSSSQRLRGLLCRESRFTMSWMVCQAGCPAGISRLRLVPAGARPPTCQQRLVVKWIVE